MSKIRSQLSGKFKFRGQDRQIIITLGSKCRHRLSSILKPQNRGNLHSWDRGDSGVGWVGDGGGCQRGFLKDITVKEDTKRAGKEGKEHLS